MVGLFVNTLPVRVRVGEAATSRLARQAPGGSGRGAGARLPPASQDPALGRHASRRGLFDTLAVHENYPLDAASRMGRTRCRRLQHHWRQADRTDQLPSRPSSMVPGSGAELPARFRPRRVRCTAVAQIGRAPDPLFDRMAAAADRHARGRSRARSSAEERAASGGGLERDRGRGAGDHPAGAVRGAGGARRPRPPPWCCEGEALSYAALEAEANRLAHRLLQLGIGPGAIVGVCLERSFELVVALLGTMQAGAAYLPLDPGYPKARLAWMIGDAGAASSSPPIATRRPLPEGVRLLVVDSADEQAARSALPTTPPGEAERGRPLLADDLAYVIYTSGSTGTPKGVAIAAPRGGQPYLWGQAALRAGPGRSGAAEDARSAFDVSVWELSGRSWPGRRSGDRPPRATSDPATWSSCWTRQAVTVSHIVPSHAAGLAREPRPRPVGRFRFAVLRRRGACRRARPRPAPRAAGSAAAQPLRPDRGHRSRSATMPTIGRRCRCGEPADRPADLEHAGLRPGPASSAGAGGCGGGAVHRRGGPGAGLPGPGRG